MVNFNPDTNTSPLATWAVNGTEAYNKQDSWSGAGMSRVTAFGSFVPVVLDAVLHVALGVSKALGAIILRTGEVACGIVGNKTDLNAKFGLSNCTGEQAVNHLTKGVLELVLCTPLSAIGVLAPSVPVAAYRALGMAKTPVEAPKLTFTQKAMNVVKNPLDGGKALLNAANTNRKTTAAIVGGVALVGAGLYTGHTQQYAGIAGGFVKDTTLSAGSLANNWVLSPVTGGAVSAYNWITGNVEIPENETPKSENEPPKSENTTPDLVDETQNNSGKPEGATIL